MIVVYAGRRVDPATPPGAPSDERFPAGNIPRVAREVGRILDELQPSTVVGSAACGADLLVLEAAAARGIRRRIILPFDRAQFRASSVADRPGDWGARFDAVIADASANGEVMELALDGGDDATYEQVNHEIFRHAADQARTTGEICRALVIWNRVSRGNDDVTESFLREAERRQWSPAIVDTLL